jgi:hypothetical protein
MAFTHRLEPQKAVSRAVTQPHTTGGWYTAVQDELHLYYSTCAVTGVTQAIMEAAVRMDTEDFEAYAAAGTRGSMGKEDAERCGGCASHLFAASLVMTAVSLGLCHDIIRACNTCQLLGIGLICTCLAGHSAWPSCTHHLSHAAAGTSRPPPRW